MCVCVCVCVCVSLNTCLCVFICGCVCVFARRPVFVTICVKEYARQYRAAGILHNDFLPQKSSLLLFNICFVPALHPALQGKVFSVMDLYLWYTTTSM